MMGKHIKMGRGFYANVVKEHSDHLPTTVRDIFMSLANKMQMLADVKRYKPKTNFGDLSNDRANTATQHAN